MARSYRGKFEQGPTSTQGKLRPASSLLLLGAGVIPAEGSVKPTAGFTLDLFLVTASLLAAWAGVR